MDIKTILGVGIAGYGAYWLYTKYATPASATTTTTPPVTTTTAPPVTTTTPPVTTPVVVPTTTAAFNTPYAASIQAKYLNDPWWVGHAADAALMGKAMYDSIQSVVADADQWAYVYQQLSGRPVNVDEIWPIINPNNRSATVTPEGFLSIMNNKGLGKLAQGLGMLFSKDWNAAFSSKRGMGTLYNEADMTDQPVPGSDFSQLDQTAPGSTYPAFRHSQSPLRDPWAGNARWLNANVQPSMAQFMTGLAGLKGIPSSRSDRVAQSFMSHLS